MGRVQDLAVSPVHWRERAGKHSRSPGSRSAKLGRFPVELIHFSVIAGLDSAIHLLAKKVDPRVIRASYALFDGLCPRV